MKVARKSPPSRQTLTLSAPAMELLDTLREGTPKSVFLQRLLEREAARREHRRFYARAAAAYTPRVCEETLALHSDHPVHEA